MAVVKIGVLKMGESHYDSDWGVAKLVVLGYVGAALGTALSGPDAGWLAFVTVAVEQAHADHTYWRIAFEAEVEVEDWVYLPNDDSNRVQCHFALDWVHEALKRDLLEHPIVGREEPQPQGSGIAEDARLAVLEHFAD